MATLRDPDNDDIAVCGIRLTDANGLTARSCARFPGWQTFVTTSLGLNQIAPRWFPGYILRQWDHEDSRRVDHVIGAYYLVRRQVFEKVGGFDERFFVYLEDLDLSRRIHAAGWRVLYDADTAAFHLGGGSSRSILARRLYYSLSSRLQYARKHFPITGMLWVYLAILIADPLIRLVRAVALMRPAEAANVLKAFGMLYASLFSRARPAPVQLSRKEH